VKETFTSRWGEDGVIVSSDFKQLEVRILGSLAEEPLYVEAFANNLDVHLVTSAAVFNKRMEDISEEERSRGKRIVFGVIYGIGPKKLAADFGQPDNLRLANQMLDAYFSTHKKVDRWLAEVRAFVSDHCWVVNKLGRFRHLPAAKSSEQMERWRAQRQAANHVIQSLGSDLTLLSMGIIDDRLRESGSDAVIIGQVHDSILLDCPRVEVEEVGQIIHEVMTNWTRNTFPFLLIPLKADVSYGPNYKKQESRVLWAAE
jgi:DNA polymerase-1